MGNKFKMLVIGAMIVGIILGGFYLFILAEQKESRVNIVYYGGSSQGAAEDLPGMESVKVHGTISNLGDKGAKDVMVSVTFTDTAMDLYDFAFPIALAFVSMIAALACGLAWSRDVGPRWKKRVYIFSYTLLSPFIDYFINKLLLHLPMLYCALGGRYGNIAFFMYSARWSIALTVLLGLILYKVTVGR